MLVTEEEYLTPEEVARKLRLHPDTVARLLRQGKLPGYKVAGSWRINTAELEAWIKNQRKHAGEE